jgi:glycosyltransferase involved in cell wall biosynthesis
LFVVQTDWIKKGLIEKFGIANDKISVFKPDLSEFDKDDIKPLNLSSGKKIIFYPATPIIYKNHIEILNALSYLRCAGNDLSDILVCFTFHEADSPRLSDVVKSEGLTDLVKFMGPISYSKVLAYYKESTVVAFPSYIETFGLPLIEAAEFGKVILVADEPYSKDVLAGYNKAVFLPINDSKAWAGALKKVIKNSEKENKNPKYSGLSETLGNRPGWRAFFSFIEGLR